MKSKNVRWINVSGEPTERARNVRSARLEGYWDAGVIFVVDQVVWLVATATISILRPGLAGDAETRHRRDSIYPTNLPYQIRFDLIIRGCSRSSARLLFAERANGAIMAPSRGRDQALSFATLTAPLRHENDHSILPLSDLVRRDTTQRTD
jgi:hypothetical protein